MNEFPDTWIQVPLSDVAQWGSGGTPSRNHFSYYGGNIPWVKTGELGQGLIEDTTEKITELGLQNSSAKIFPKGSVIIAMYGATIGQTGILGIDAATNQACAVGTPIEGITTTEYLFYYLLSQKNNFIDKGKGGAQPNISQKIIRDWPIPLAPLKEQKRIADKLDILFARIDECHNRLARIPQILEKFRQNVLADAMSGYLTEDWRSLQELPNGWKSSRLSELCLSITDGDHQAPPQVENGIPFITISAINDKQLNLSKATRFVPHSYFNALNDIRKAQFGDILFSVTGSIGIPAIVNTSEPFVFQRHIAILKSDSSQILNEFLFYYLCTDDIKEQAIANLNQL